MWRERGGGGRKRSKVRPILTLEGVHNNKSTTITATVSQLIYEHTYVTEWKQP